MRRSAIVILGAAVLPDGTASPSLARRIARGAKAYHDGACDVVICSGGLGAFAPSEAEVMQTELLKLGVPQEALFLEDRSRTTFENAVNSIKIAKTHGYSHLTVVSDRYHLPRALLTFRIMGMPCRGLSAGSSANSGALKRAQFWIRETLALPFYLLKLLVWRTGKAFGS